MFKQQGINLRWGRWGRMSVDYILEKRNNCRDDSQELEGIESRGQMMGLEGITAW